MAREHLFRAMTKWTGSAQGPTSSYEGYSRDYVVEIEGKSALQGSAASAFRGDASLHNPEDLLVAAVSTCHMLSFLAIAARAGVSIHAYVDDVTATMTFRDGKVRFVEATLRPTVTVKDSHDASKIDAMHEQANQECFIANSLNFPVHHEGKVTVLGE